MRRVAIGADHAGYDLKEEIKRHLGDEGFQVEDFGTHSRDSVDYPDYAKPVAQAVAAKKAEAGILICSTGIGMSMAANRVPGVRAALVNDVFTAQMSRQHNDANVLVLGAKMMDRDRLQEILKVWFSTPFEGGRHVPRLEKIARYEREHKK